MLVLRNAGPVGAPGMPEWGGLPIPKKLLALGVRDMVRISDARMSGTHYGTCILHVSPESAVGGPLALVQQRRHDRDRHRGPAPAPGCRRRRTGAPPRRLAARRPHRMQRGFTRLYREHVTQAHEGCDFDFLQGAAPTPEPVIY